MISEAGSALKHLLNTSDMKSAEISGPDISALHFLFYDCGFLMN